MILKPLILSLCTLSLLSCGQDWEVVTGPVKKYGEPDDPIVEEANPASARPPRSRRRPAAPRPLKDNPFAVPEVTKELPNEKDLKPAGPTGTPIPIDPTEAKPPKPTVTAKPPAPAE